MRILLVSSQPPSRAHANGGTTRQYQLYKRLIDLGHEVVVVGAFPPGDEQRIVDLVEDGFDVRPYRRPRSRGLEILRAFFRNPLLFLRAPLMTIDEFVADVYRHRLEPLAEEVLREKPVDVVGVEIVFSLLRDTGDVPSVISYYFVASADYADRAERASGLSRIMLRELARRSRRYERKWSARHDALVVMSESEAALMRDVAGDALPTTYVIGNGADLDTLGSVGNDPGEGRVLFTGTLEFGPNIVAAQWIAREVWPHVLAKVPDAQLDIVGKDPPPKTLELGKLAGVTVTGSVPSMAPHYERASVCTLPMLEGGGTRLKLADAFAARRAVVSTTNGATGVAVTDGEHLLVRDSAEAFADAIVQLLKNDDERARIAASGRAFAERELDWRTLGDEWERVLREVAG